MGCYHFAMKSLFPPTTEAGADPVVLKELHFRRIDMRGYQRSDGLYQIEGRVTDRKPYNFIPASGGREVPANEEVHDMGVCLVFDRDMVVQEVHSFMNAMPYGNCPGGDAGLQAMKGAQMTKGWRREVQDRLGGDRSCAHLRDLLVPMATAAVQSMSVLRRNDPLRLDKHGRPAKIDSCHAYSAHGELVLQHWPEFYRPKKTD
jgi:Protein of unknown function (DUF2889)